MTVTDEAKLFAIRQQLITSQRNLTSAIKIINYVFERVEPEPASPDNDSPSDTASDPVNGLYPGQLPEFQTLCEEPEVESEECLE
jgi:hypothetical protein